MKFITTCQKYETELLFNENLVALCEEFDIPKLQILKQFGKCGLVVIVSALMYLAGNTITDYASALKNAMDNGINRAEKMGLDISDEDRLRREVDSIYKRGS